MYTIEVLKKIYSAMCASAASGGNTYRVTFSGRAEYAAAQKALLALCRYHREEGDCEYFSGSEGDEDEGPSKPWAVEIRRR